MALLADSLGGDEGLGETLGVDRVDVWGLLRLLRAQLGFVWRSVAYFWRIFTKRRLLRRKQAFGFRRIHDASRTITHMIFWGDILLIGIQQRLLLCVRPWAYVHCFDWSTD